MKRFVLFLLFLSLAGAAFFYFRTAEEAIVYKTEKVRLGDIVFTIGAVGTLEPEDVVDVGAQVAGLIKEFGVGTDGKPIDHNSPVDEGTILARIDDSLYQFKVEQSRALLRSAEKQVTQARAKREQAKAAVEQAKANTLRAEAERKLAIAQANRTSKEWERIRTMRSRGTASEMESDAALSAHEAGLASVALADASVAQSRAAESGAVASLGDADAAIEAAEAAVGVSRAVLKQDEINLGYCIVRSRVKGTIIDRRVTVGQTLQSAQSIPSLFLIAKDLSRMKIWASVNEADIGRVREGQVVRFTIDDRPDRIFEGKVGLVRLNAANTQNVVVYTVEVIVDNKEMLLKPYMTAYLKFEIDRRENVLVVPNAALRRKTTESEKQSPTTAKASAGKSRRRKGTVQVKEGDSLREVSVTLGLSDGVVTEVMEGELKVDDEVVVAEVKPVGKNDAKNPFAPSRPR